MKKPTTFFDHLGRRIVYSPLHSRRKYGRKAPKHTTIVNFIFKIEPKTSVKVTQSTFNGTKRGAQTHYRAYFTSTKYWYSLTLKRSWGLVIPARAKRKERFFAWRYKIAQKVIWATKVKDVIIIIIIVIIIIIKIMNVYYVVFTPVWWIAKDSLGIVALGIVHDVTHCFNLGKYCVSPC